MERRVHRRFAKRVEVRFWRRAETQSHSSFTTNLSKSGVFLGSASALVPGERLRVEIVDRDNGFFAEGRVVRVHRVSIALRHIDQPGVGVRFMMPEELVEELLPLARQAGPGTAQLAAQPPLGPPPGRLEPEELASEGEEIDASAPATRVVPVTFDDPSTFLSVYHRDIQSGGLFVSTAEPAALHETVWIELQLPLNDERPKLFEALVVQRFPAEGAVAPGRNLLGGMAVQFLEPEKVVAELKPLIQRLRR